METAMKTTDQPSGSRQRELFLKALEKPIPAERHAFLDGACGDDHALRASVEALLAHHQEDSFLEESPAGGALTVAPLTLPAEDPADETPGGRIGRYKLLQKVGEGGCGVVYMAEQEEPVRRRVALKVIRLGMDTKSVIARFEAERQALALMDHPNIARVLEAGATDAGRPYFVMELVRGVKITEYCDEAKLSTRQRLDLFIKVCQAIQHAHQKGIIHRDIKPSNILVTINDGVAVPKVIDFGIAKATEGRLTDKTLFTQFEALIGTPAYMSPEQAVMTSLDIDTRSDIYSLGVLLYELLAGSTPFDAKELMASGLDAMRKTIREKEPVRPSTRLATLQDEELTITAKRRSADTSKLMHQLQGDLDWIVMKCLEKDRTRRYETANGLASDIQRHLNNEAVLARPPSAAYRFQKMVRRNKLAFAAATAVATALVIGLGAATVMFFRERLARNGEQHQRLEAQAAQKVAETEQRRADGQARLAEQNLYSSDMRLASQAVHEGAFNHARELLERHLPQRGAEDLRGFEWRYLGKAVQDSEPFRTFDGLPAPSGWLETLLSRSERFLYNQSLGQLRAWDMTTWEPVPIVPPPQPASVQWQYDPSRGSAYAVDPTQHTVAVYTLPKFESGPTVRLPGPFFKVAMSDDRHTLAVGFQEGASHRVLVWDLARDARIGEFGNFEAAISVLTFSRDGTLLAASSTNGVAGLWNLKTLRPLAAPPSSPSHRRGLEFTPDNTRLLSGEYPNRSVWDIGARQAFTVERADQTDPESFGFSPDAKYLVVSWDGIELTLLDSRSLLTVGTMRGHRGRIVGIAFSPDGKLMASASVDQTARIWDLATQMEVGMVGGFGERISDVEFSADGQNIVLIGGFGQIRVYQLSAVVQRGLFAKIQGWQDEGFGDLALSPDERRLATISVDGTLTLWDRRSRSLIRSVSFPRYTPESFPRLAFSPDGEQVAWVTGDALRIMLVKSGDINATNIDGNHEINSIAFSPDGRELAFGCGKQLLIRELVSGRQQRFIATDDEVFAVTYSPDGTRIAFGDRQGTVTLYERGSGRVLSKEVKAHPPYVSGIAMSPDGRLLATCGADSTIKLWRVQPGGLHLQDTLRGHMGYVNRVAFSPDGTRLVSACGDQTLKIWDPSRAAELATLYGHHHYAGSVKFTKDGRTIYSSGYDGEIHFWEAPPLAEIDLSTKSMPIQSRRVRSNELK